MREGKKRREGGREGGKEGEKEEEDKIRKTERRKKHEGR